MTTSTPTARPRRRLLGSLAAAAALTAALLGGTAAAAPAAHADPSCSGVTVVVDFTALGGGVQTGCAQGSPANGLAALTGAGFSYGFVPRFPGFICAINTQPDPCNGAPATAYWSYWHATPGGSWTYSDLGAASYTPAPGTDEGWSFGAGTAPGITAP
ncbi:flagellar hook-length control protein FliK [Kitasatospora sp. LaBMicrA B282]|uniref:flagellar hook-length control protein FliK n=1 Tax=Kitasatospora sp. LaBMicrA B282 TaxID=3420949 RepID=UPI003D09D260